MGGKKKDFPYFTVVCVVSPNPFINLILRDTASYVRRDIRSFRFRVVTTNDFQMK